MIEIRCILKNADAGPVTEIAATMHRCLKRGTQVPFPVLWVVITKLIVCIITVSATPTGFAGASDAKSRIIAALESNVARIEDMSLEYTATVMNKGAAEPLFVEHYTWSMRGDSQRLSYTGGDGWHHARVLSGGKQSEVHEKYGASRRISFEDIEPMETLDYNHNQAAIPGFLFNDLAPSSFLEMLRSSKATFAVEEDTGTIELAEVPGPGMNTTLRVALDNGIVTSRKITCEGRGFAEFVVKDLALDGGISFMRTGVLHRYAHKRDGNGILYSENTQDVLVEVRELGVNTGLSDVLFAVVPLPGDEALVKINGVWVNYFATDEEKRVKLRKNTERTEALAQLVGKPAPALHIQNWVNRKPLTTGKRTVYLFWKRNCGPSVQLLKEYNKQYPILSPLVEVIGIHAFQDAENLDQFIQEHDISIPIGVDEAGKTCAAYPVEGWPESFLVDEAGNFTADMHGCPFLGNFLPLPAELEEAYFKVFSNQ